MKTQHKTPIQFSGYPLSIVKSSQEIKKIELTAIKPSSIQPYNQKNSIVNDPKNWDIDWFNSYE
jgi:hypothetical protein